MEGWKGGRVEGSFRRDWVSLSVCCLNQDFQERQDKRGRVEGWKDGRMEESFRRDWVSLSVLLSEPGLSGKTGKTG